MLQISVIVITYNSQWDAIRKTLNSIMCQKRVNFEVIVADDGSRDNHMGKIINYFNGIAFSKYQLVMHITNQGTVKNVFDGIKQAKGKYVKFISPGDYLYDESTLLFFYEYAENHPAEAYFGRAIYYVSNNRKQLIIDKHAPKDLRPWLKNKRSQIRYNYIRKGDYAVGASFFVKTDVIYKYLSRIENLIKYTEDFSYVMMIAEGKRILYIDHPIIFYEYGTGVSTKGQSKWQKLIQRDNQMGFQMIRPYLSYAERLELKKERTLGDNLLRYIINPKLMFSRLCIKSETIQAINVLNEEDIKHKFQIILDS